MIYWLCGQPASGKTTLGKEIYRHYEDLNEKVMMIDGDELRDILCNHDYSPEGRELNLQAVLNIARYLDSKNMHVIIAVVAPYSRHRDALKRTNDMREVYLYTSDLRGREGYFVDNFEVPNSNALHLDTGKLTVEECVKAIIDGNINDRN